MSNQDPLLLEALEVLRELGLPRAQLNERSALSLLAILDLRPGMTWQDSKSPLMGITPIMDWMQRHYGKTYAPNTRETVRRQTMHQFVAAAIALYNPDRPDRAVNSPKAAYQISPIALELIKKRGLPDWGAALAAYREKQASLAEQYAAARDLAMVPVTVGDGEIIKLSPGAHSLLMKEIVEEFAPRFAPGSHLVYAGDTGDKFGYFDEAYLAGLGVRVDSHGKMPDVVLHDVNRDWLLLVESVTSHGPVDGKRHRELSVLFAHATPGLVYVTAFPDRATMGRYLPEIAWETEVWVADAPTHLIHFNGERFLGPYGCADRNQKGRRPLLK